MSNSSKATKTPVSGQVLIPEAANYQGILVIANRKKRYYKNTSVAADGSFEMKLKGKGTYSFTAYDSNDEIINFTRPDGISADIGPWIKPYATLKVKPGQKKELSVEIEYPSIPDPITGLPLPFESVPTATKEDMGVLEPGATRSGSIGQAGESDWYRFGQSGQGMQYFTISPVDARFSVYDATGILLAESTGSQSDFSYTPGQSGTVFVAVSSGGTPAVFDYSLSALAL